MGGILQLEADRRAINITVNSLDTDLELKQVYSLGSYPTPMYSPCTCTYRLLTYRLLTAYLLTAYSPPTYLPPTHRLLTAYLPPTYRLLTA